MPNTEKEKLKRPSRLTFIITLSGIIVTVIIALVMLSIYQLAYKEETEKEVYDRYYVLITDDDKTAIWGSVYQGAFERGLEENVYVDWLSERLGERYAREEQMQIAIASGVDGIIVTADESPEMTDLINEASDSGIPVVTLYGDNTRSKRCSFVGVGSYNLGREYGRQALDIVSERLAEEKDDKVFKVAAVVSANAQDLDQNILCSGIQETLEHDRNSNFYLISVDDTNAFSVEESIRDIFMEMEQPDIIICLSELSASCVYQAVVDYNRVGRVSILAYYDSDTIINAIDRNVVRATVSIDTAQMGQYCVDALQEYNEMGYTSQYFTADITIINNDNVDDYLKKEEAPDDIG